MEDSSECAYVMERYLLNNMLFIMFLFTIAGYGAYEGVLVVDKGLFS